MVRRTGRGTDTPCPRWSSGSKGGLNRKLRKQSHEAILAKWKDPTSGSQPARRRQFKDCGEECFACPNDDKPMYPVCRSGCEPRCAGIAAAMRYAEKYGAETVRQNLLDAEKECRKLRAAAHKKRGSGKRRSGSRSSKRGRSRPRSRARSHGRRKSRR
jgi:hypothetical protein